MNKYRGEFEIKLGEETFLLRPTYGALAYIESVLDIPVPSLIPLFAARGAKMTEIVVILTAGIRGGGVDTTTEEVFEKVRDSGFLKVISEVTEDKSNVILDFLIFAATGKIKGEDSKSPETQGVESSKKNTA